MLIKTLAVRFDCDVAHCIRWPERRRLTPTTVEELEYRQDVDSKRRQVYRCAATSTIVLHR